MLIRWISLCQHLRFDGSFESRAGNCWANAEAISYLLRLLPANAFFTTPRVTSFTEIRRSSDSLCNASTMLDFCLLVPDAGPLHTTVATLKSSKRVANFCRGENC